MDFQTACMNGHLETAKRLVESFGHVDIHVYDDAAFLFACAGGHLETAK